MQNGARVSSDAKDAVADMKYASRAIGMPLHAEFRTRGLIIQVASDLQTQILNGAIAESTGMVVPGEARRIFNFL